MMTTRRSACGGQILSPLFDQASKGLRHLLLSSLVVPLVFLAGCDKSGEQPTTQASPSGSTPVSAFSPANTGNNYVLGTVVRFGQGGGSERFRQSGWSETEKDATWTIGNLAKLSFPIAPEKQSLNLRMSLSGLAAVVNATNPSPQPVEVLVNGQKIADWDVSARADFNATIPASIVKDGGTLVIELKIPKAASPKSLGVGEDARVLGVYCFEAAITKGA